MQSPDQNLSGKKREAALQSLHVQGKIALVTGGSRGIGRAIARELVQQGASKIIITYALNEVEANHVVSELHEMGATACAIQANNAEPEALERLFAEIEERYEHLDILINNAASGVLRPGTTLRAKHWDWTMNVNARGSLFCAQQAVPLMKYGGSIVNMTSMGSQRYLPDYLAVGASKAALETITRYLAVELSPRGIVVNAVAGGLVETDALSFFPQREQIVQAARERTPAGRLVSAEDIAGVVVFLCSPAASMIRGQILVVDGGSSLLG